jgi:hypothetical protein
MNGIEHEREHNELIITRMFKSEASVSLLLVSICCGPEIKIREQSLQHFLSFCETC